MASLARNRHGFLSIRFRAPLGGRSIQCCEGTKVRVQLVDGEWAPEDPTAYRQLLRWVDRITEEIDAGTFQYLAHFPDGNKARLFKPGGPMLFKFLAEEYLADRADEIRASTTGEYSGIVNQHLIPALGEVPLSDFTDRPKEITRQLKEHLSKRSGRRPKNADPSKAAPLSNRRKKYVFVILRAILQKEKIDFPVPEYTDADPVRELAFCTEAERDLYLSTELDFYRPFFTVAFFSGMQHGEQLANRETSLDFTNDLIGIYTSIVRGVETKPKTKRRMRKIDMLPEVRSALKRWLKIRKKIQADHDFLWCRPDGRRLDVEYLSKWVWHQTLKRAKMRPREMYATRHTFATLFLMEGYSPAWVAQMMGDKIETVIKHYFHFIPEMKGPLNRSTRRRRTPQRA